MQKFHFDQLRMFEWNLCHKSSLVMFDFTIDLMFDFEHPFARNGLPTLGKWHQGPCVVDNKKVVFFLHGNLPLFYILTLQHFFHGLKFFLKGYGGPFHLFGGNPPITRPFFMLFLVPFSSSILLWFIQTLILWHYYKMCPSSLWISLDFEWIWTFLPSEIV